MTSPSTERADPIPSLFREVCEYIQATTGFIIRGLDQVLVTEYATDAPIGWHKDRPVFGDVMGVSLVSPCMFRLRKPLGDRKWQRASISLEPRSTCILSGAARWH